MELRRRLDCIPPAACTLVRHATQVFEALLINLLVGNLPPGATSAQVHALFSRYGRVARVLQTRDPAGPARGAYFVDLEDAGFAPPIGGLHGLVFGGRPLEVITSARTGAGATAGAAPAETGPQPLTAQRVQQYIWTRYVEFKPAPFDLDEEEGLALLRRHHEARPIGADAECFYLGILAYERSFASESALLPCLRLALDAFEAWRGQVSQELRWAPVDDRHEDVIDQLRRLGRTA